MHAGALATLLLWARAPILAGLDAVSLGTHPSSVDRSRRVRSTCWLAMHATALTRGRVRASQRARVAKRFGRLVVESCQHDDFDRNLDVGSPGGMDRERSSATPRPQPFPDALALEQQRRGSSANIIRPDSVREQGPVGDPDGRQVEHAPELQRRRTSLVRQALPARAARKGLSRGRGALARAAALARREDTPATQHGHRRPGPIAA